MTKLCPKLIECRGLVVITHLLSLQLLSIQKCSCTNSNAFSCGRRDLHINQTTSWDSTWHTPTANETVVHIYDNHVLGEVLHVCVPSHHLCLKVVFNFELMENMNVTSLHIILIQLWFLDVLVHIMQ